LFALVLLCPKFVQSGLNSILSRDFDLRRRHFHTVFNRTVENFHATFKKIREFLAHVAKELLWPATPRVVSFPASVVTFLPAGRLAAERA
jgi:hypothetical protein